MNEIVPKQILNSGQGTDQDEDTLDLASYLDVLVDNRWLIALVTFVVSLFGIAYAFIATPIYEANILVQVEDNATSSSNIMGDLANAFDLKSAATAEMEILRSRYIVSRAVDNARLYLTAEPKHFPIFGRWVATRQSDLSEPGVFGIGGYAWGTENVEVGVFEIPKALAGERFVLRAQSGNRFQLTQADAGITINGRVGEPIKTETPHGVMEVQIDRITANPDTEFLIKREPVLDTIEELQKALVISERGKQSGIIGVSLQGKDPQKTARILNEIGAEYVRQNVERKSAEAEKSLIFLENQLPQMKADLENAEAKYNALRNSRGTVDLGEEAKTVLQQSVLSQTRLIELKQKRDELLTRYQEANPLVQAVDHQMLTLKNEIALVNDKIRTMPSIEQDVLRLTRDVKVTTDLYTSLLNSAQQLRLLKASRVGNARLIDQAVAPLHPIRPKRLVISALAVMVGLCVGVICAFIRKALFGGIEDPHEIEQILGLSVTAAIPYTEQQESMFARAQAKIKTVSLLAKEDPTDTAIESLRSFRTSLQFSMLRAKNRIVMITGPTPSVGKSFVSANFAAVLASSGKKVLLIDADLRKGYLNTYFGKERNNGFSELIAGNNSVENTIHKQVVENLDFISTGAFPPRPAELLGHDRFKELLTEFSATYDYVVIDTAPVLAVADPLVIAPHVGAIFNVVRSNVSTIGEIEETVKRLNQMGSAVTGVVFNGLKPRMGGYGNGSKYGKYRYAQYKYAE